MVSSRVAKRVLPWLLVSILGAALASCGVFAKRKSKTVTQPPPAGDDGVDGGEGNGKSAPPPSQTVCGSLPSAPYDYKRHVSTIMQAACVSCHADGRAAAGFRLDRYDDPSALYSLFERWNKALSRVNDGTMPPQSAGHNLAECEKDILRQWVAAGLPLDAGTPSPPSTLCNDEASQPMISQLRRLTKSEYTNTLRDLIGDEGFGLVEEVIQIVPNENSSESFDVMGQEVVEGHISAYFAVAEAVARVVANERIVMPDTPACIVEDEPSAACVRQFITQFGARALRRELTAEEHQLVETIYMENRGLSSDRLKAVVSWLLQSPSFLYKLELDGAEKPGGRLELSSYARAARLSYLAWGSMPDAELFRAAADGSLMSHPERQVERVLGTPRSQAWLKRFFSQWLRLDRMPELYYSAEFVGSIVAATLKSEAIREMEGFIGHVVWGHDGSYADLLLSQHAVGLTPNLAKVYGVPEADEADLPGRRGLLTRAAMLIQSAEDTSPIHRGAFLRRQILCDDLPSPGDLGPVLPEQMTLPPLDPTLTARQRWEAKTAPATCMSCHRGINPLGFALESYDSIGRERTLEATRDANGAIVNHLPLNTTVAPALEQEGEAPLAGPLELSERLAVSEKARRCFVRMWFRFAAGRLEKQADTCTIDRLHRTLNASSIKSLFSETMSLREFNQRKILP